MNDESLGVRLNVRVLGTLGSTTTHDRCNSLLIVSISYYCALEWPMFVDSITVFAQLSAVCRFSVQYLFAYLRVLLTFHIFTVLYTLRMKGRVAEGAAAYLHKVEIYLAISLE